MNEIINDIKTHVVVTHSGGHYFITPQQNENLMMVGQNDYFEVEGNKIKGSSIAEVMTTEAYYEAHPQKKPAPVFEDGFKKYEREDVKALAGDLAETAPTRGVEQMLKGLGRFIAEEQAKGKTPHNAIAMYENMEKKLKQRSVHA